jgi:hypothetical protein
MAARMMRILKQASKEKRVKLYLAWEHDFGGCIFPCNAAGEVNRNSLTTDALRNLVALRRGQHPTIPSTVKPMIIQREVTIEHHAVGLCECGAQVKLERDINLCRCGCQYGKNGQLTGESRALRKSR